MKKLHILCISSLITLMASLPSWADDVDIYLRHAAALTDTVRPNILFMLDNSGSMKYNIRLPDGTPTSETRIDVLKQALLQTLNEVHNVNVGLARFAYLIKPNGPVNAPIMFPVFYVDADMTEVPGEMNNSTIEVSSSISRHEDDAEENTGSGKMLLDRKSLRMVYLKQSDDFKGIKIEQPIDKSSNVAVQWLGNVRDIPTVGNKNAGVVKIGGNSLWLGGDPEPNVANNQGDSLIALRFNKLSIPVGAKIEKAQVEFISDKDYSYESEKDKLKLNIYGAANDGVPTVDPSGKEFKIDKEYLTKEGNFPKTKTKVEWIIADPLDQGQTYVTEDISSILQEIVNRAPKKDGSGNDIGGTGWQENNSIVLLFQSAGDSPVATKGFVSAIDNVLYPPPLLRLSWSIESAQVNLRSGKGTWNATKNAYNVNMGDHAMESGDKITTDGMYLGYKPEKGGIDVADLKKVMDDAKLAKEKTYADWNTAKATLTQTKTTLSTINTTGKFSTASGFTTTAQNSVNTINTKMAAATKPTDKEMWQTVLPAAESMLTLTQALFTTVNPKNPEITSEQINTTQIALSTAENTVKTARDALSQKGLLYVLGKDGNPTVSKTTGQPTLTAGGTQLVNIETLLGKIQTMWKQVSELKLVEAKKAVLDAQVAEKTANQQYLDAKAAYDKAVADYNAGKKVKIVVKTESWIGVNFSSLSIPKGASIQEAYITFTHQGSWSDFSVERSAELNLDIYGEKSPAPKGFSADPTKISERPKTKALATWSPVQGFADKMTFQTVDLSSVLQEVINQEGWQSKNNVAFIFENKDKSPNMKGFRRFVGVKDSIKYLTGANAGTTKVDQYTTTSDADLVNFSNLPELTVKYSVGIQAAGGGDSDEQIVGLRFENVDVPKGATVVRASIDFQADITSEDSSNLLIQIEDTDNAVSFKDEEKNISSRKIIKDGILWPDIPPWEKGATYTTPELKTLVQKVVDKKDWCGGRGGMAFVISALEKEKPFRIAKSFDNAAQFAPVLNIEYDFKSIPKETCIQQTYSGQIAFQNDDAEESISGKDQGDVYLVSKSLEMGYYSAFGSSRLIGFRFRDIPIGKEAKVVSAHLVLTADKNLSEANTKFNIMAEKNAEPAMFSKNSANLSKRGKTKAKVAWEIGQEAWKRGQTYTSPDISEVIQEIIEQGNWEAYNSMNLFLSGQGRRDAVGFDAAPQAAAILRIQVDGFLGEGGKHTMTVRTRLKKVTKSIEIPASLTPIADALYESALYYRSNEVTHGISRYNQALNLVSHPGTYKGGELLKPPACTTAKPFEPECAAEQITGAARYKSPIESACQSNHIIFLTDGIATVNESADKIKELIKDFRKECDTKYVDPDDPTKTISVSKNEMCALDLAEFLQNSDNSAKFKGEQRVTLHTIGFQLGKGWTAMYKDPTGRAVVLEDGIYRYDDNKEPVPAGVEILPNGYKEKEGETKSNAKVVKFLKTLAARGGGKFYAAESAEELLSAFKAIVGQAITNSTTFAAPGVSVNRFSNLFHNKETYYSVFKPDQYARWNGNIKKYHICQGNEGSCVAPELIDAKGQPAVNPDTKEIKSTALSFWSSGNPTPDGSFVTLGGAGERVPVSAERRIFTYLGETPPGQDNNIQIDAESNAIQPANPELIRLVSNEQSITNEEREKTILWIRGQDVMDEDKDNLVDEDRWKIADPLHSSPGTITYGGSAGSPVVKLFIGTNEGLIRMIDDQSGTEEWAFLPKELLPKQYDLMMNASESGHIYGIDNTPTFWTHDVNNNVQIEPGMGDFVKMYVSMRRGGNNIYALDVTGGEGGPGAPPKLMWTIKGGKEGSPGFGKLGQTWSRPKPTKVRVDGKSRMVLLFGGGYHESQDEVFQSTEKEDSGGNALFMVDAKTGALLWSASNEGAYLNLEQMIYPIPSDVALKDTDDDGNTDRIYVGDLGGQVWRIDIENIDSTNFGVGLLFATVSGGGGTDRRRFFYPPEVVRVEDKTYSTVPTYDLVLMVSGTRPDPLEREVHNRIFAFRDLQLTPMGSAEGVAPITSDHLYDATSNVVQEGDEDARIQAKQDLKDKQGWYINLQESEMTQGSWIGEKGLSSPIVLKGKAYVATYVPPLESEDQCNFSEGESRLYALDILNAAAVADLQSDGQLNKADRSKKMGSGLIHTPEPLNPSGTGETVMSFSRYPGTPDIKETRVPQRSFWMQK